MKAHTKEEAQRRRKFDLTSGVELLVAQGKIQPGWKKRVRIGQASQWGYLDTTSWK